MPEERLQDGIAHGTAILPQHDARVAAHSTVFVGHVRHREQGEGARVGAQGLKGPTDDRVQVNVHQTA